MSTLDTILQFLQTKGLNFAQAAGVAGNLQVESGLDPTAANPREGAIGLAQWEGGRRTALQAYARSKGTTETDLGTQLNFLWSELQGPENSAYKKLTATNDPGTAAAVFDQYYERSSGAARQTRIAKAQQIAKDNGGGFLAGVGAGAGAVLGGVFGGNSDAGASAGAAAGAAAGDALAAINPFAHWQTDAAGLGMKIVAGLAVAGLAVVGALQTVKN